MSAPATTKTVYRTSLISSICTLLWLAILVPTERVAVKTNNLYFTRKPGTYKSAPECSWALYVEPLPGNGTSFDHWMSCLHTHDPQSARLQERLDSPQWVPLIFMCQHKECEIPMSVQETDQLFTDFTLENPSTKAKKNCYVICLKGAPQQV
jgi:hypothetical protein